MAREATTPEERFGQLLKEARDNKILADKSAGVPPDKRMTIESFAHGLGYSTRNVNRLMAAERLPAREVVARWAGLCGPFGESLLVEYDRLVLPLHPLDRVDTTPVVENVRTKGGVGKGTLVAALAQLFADVTHDVGIIDLDMSNA